MRVILLFMQMILLFSFVAATDRVSEYKISGKVVDEAGEGVDGATVSVKYIDNNDQIKEKLITSGVGGAIDLTFKGRLGPKIIVDKIGFVISEDYLWNIEEKDYRIYLKKGVLKKIRILSRKTGKPLAGQSFKVKVIEGFNSTYVKNIRSDKNGVASFRLPFYQASYVLWGKGYALERCDAEISLLSDVYLSDEVRLMVKLPEGMLSSGFWSLSFSKEGSSFYITMNSHNLSNRVSPFVKFRNGAMSISNMSSGNYSLRIKGKLFKIMKTRVLLDQGRLVTLTPKYIKPSTMRLMVESKIETNATFCIFLFNASSKRPFSRPAYFSKGFFWCDYRRKSLVGNEDVYFIARGYYPYLIKDSFGKKPLAKAKLTPGEAVSIKFMHEGKPIAVKGKFSYHYRWKGLKFYDSLSLHSKSTSVVLKIPLGARFWFGLNSDMMIGEYSKKSITVVKGMTLPLRIVKSKVFKTFFVDAKSKRVLVNKQLGFGVYHGTRHKAEGKYFTNDDGFVFVKRGQIENREFTFDVPNYLPQKLKAKDFKEGQRVLLNKGARLRLDVNTPIVVNDFRLINKSWSKQKRNFRGYQIELNKKNSFFKLFRNGLEKGMSELTFKANGFYPCQVKLNLEYDKLNIVSINLKPKPFFLIASNAGLDEMMNKPMVSLFEGERSNTRYLRSTKRSSLKVMIEKGDERFTKFSLFIRGYLPSKRMPIPKVFPSKPVMVPLERGNTLDVSVVDAAGKIIVGAGVDLYFKYEDNYFSNFLKTNEKGLLSISGLPKGKISFKVSAKGFEDNRVESYLVSRKLGSYKVVLKKSRMIKVTLEGLVDKIDAKIELTLLSSNGRGSFSSSTHRVFVKGNTFERNIKKDKVGSFYVTVKGYQVSSVYQLVSGLSKTQEISVKLIKGLHVTFSVLDEDEKALKGAQIRISRLGDGFERHQFSDWNTKGNDFSFGSLSKGEWSVSVSCAGYLVNKFKIDIKRSSSQTIEIQLQKEAVFYGLLIDKASKKVLKNVHGQLVILDGKRKYFKTNEKGAFQVLRLSGIPKSYKIEVDQYFEKKIVAAEKVNGAADPAALRRKVFFDGKEVEAHVFEIQRLSCLTIKTNVQKLKKNSHVRLIFHKGNESTSVYIYQKTPSLMKCWVKEEYFSYNKVSITFVGYRSTTPVALKPFEDGDQEVSFVLDKGSALEGAVSSVDGAPLSDVSVSLYCQGADSESVSLSGKTNADGVFLITGLPIEGKAMVNFSKKGFKPKRMKDISLSSKNKVLAIELLRSKKIRIKPNLTAKKLPNEIRVGLYKNNKKGARRSTMYAYLNKDGYYEFYLASDEYLYFDILLEGYRISDKISFLGKDIFEQEFLVDFEKGLVFTCVVVGANNEIVKRCSVYVELTRSTDAKKISFSQSDYKGNRFTFGSLDEGSLEVQISHPDYLNFNETYDVTDSLDKEIQITLQKSLVLKGQLIDVVTQKPLANSTASLYFDESRISKYVSSDKNGYFSIKGFDNFPNKLTFKKDGYVDVIREGGYSRNNLRIEFSEGAKLKLLFQGQAEHLRYVHVKLKKKGDSKKRFSHNFKHKESKKSLTIKGLKSGSYEINIESVVMSDFKPFKLNLVEDQVVEHVVVIKSKVKVLLKTSLKNKIYGDARMYGKDGKELDRRQINFENGRFFFFVDPTKDVSVRCYLDNHLPSTLIKIPYADSLTIELPYDFSVGNSISGRVVDEKGKGIRGVSLSTRDKGNGLYRHESTDKKGYYSLKGLGFGSFKVSARHKDYLNNTKITKITDEENPDVPFVLSKGRSYQIKVFDVSAAKTLKNISVSIEAESQKKQYISRSTLRTNSKGEFHFSGVKAGAFFMQVSVKGYAIKTYLFSELDEAKGVFTIELNKESRVKIIAKGEMAMLKGLSLRFTKVKPNKGKLNHKVEFSVDSSYKDGNRIILVSGVSEGDYYIQLIYDWHPVSKIVTIYVGNGGEFETEIEIEPQELMVILIPEDKKIKLPRSISLSMFGPHMSYSGSAEIGSDQKYRFFIENPKYTHFQYLVEGYASSRKILFDHTSKKQEVVFTLKKGLWHQMKFLTKEKKPIAEVRYSYVLISDGVNKNVGHSYGNSDSKGRSKKVFLKPGLYEVECYKGAWRKKVEVELSDQSDLDEIEMADSRHIKGLAVSGETILRGVEIRLLRRQSSKRWDRTSLVKTDNNGNFDFGHFSTSDVFLIKVDGLLPYLINTKEMPDKINFEEGYEVVLKLKLKEAKTLELWDVSVNANFKKKGDSSIDYTYGAKVARVKGGFEVRIAGLLEGTLVLTTRVPGYNLLKKEFEISSNVEEDMVLVEGMSYPLKFEIDYEKLPTSAYLVLTKGLKVEKLHLSRNVGAPFVFNPGDYFKNFDRFSIQMEGFYSDKSYRIPTVKAEISNELIALAQLNKMKISLKKSDGSVAKNITVVISFLHENGFKGDSTSLSPDHNGECVFHVKEFGKYLVTLKSAHFSVSSQKEELDFSATQKEFQFTLNDRNVIRLLLIDKLTGNPIVSKKVRVYAYQEGKSTRAILVTDLNGFVVIKDLDISLKEVFLNVYGYAYESFVPLNVRDGEKITFIEDAVLELRFVSKNTRVKNAHLAFGDARFPGSECERLIRSRSKVVSKNPRTHSWIYRGLKEGTYRIKVQPNDMNVSKEIVVDVFQGQTKTYYFETVLQKKILIELKGGYGGRQLSYVLQDGNDKSKGRVWVSSKGRCTIFVNQRKNWSTFKLKIDGFKSSSLINIVDGNQKYIFDPEKE